MHGVVIYMLNLRNFQFFGSAGSSAGWPNDGLPEIGVVGRSNVGKSSLINSLLGTRKAARVSGTPGKTRLLNFFRVDNQFYLVDFPGYGYAKVSKKEQAEWRKIIEEYLQGSEQLRAILLLVDGRHKSFKSDIEMKAWFDAIGIPSVLIATKADKLSRSKLNKIWKANLQDFYLAGLDQVIFSSAVSGMGKKEIINKIEKYINEQGD